MSRLVASKLTSLPDVTLERYQGRILFVEFGPVWLCRIDSREPTFSVTMQIR